MAKQTIHRPGRGRTRRLTVNNPHNPNARVQFLIDDRSVGERPQLNICKIRPERIRDLNTTELRKLQFFIGPPTKKERISKTSPHGLLHRLVFNLVGARSTEDLSPRSREAYIKTYGEEPADSSKIRRSYEQEVDRTERQIWDAQQKKGCSIATTDVAARDYVRGGGTDDQLINKMRGRRKAKIR